MFCNIRFAKSSQLFYEIKVGCFNMTKNKRLTERESNVYLSDMWKFICDRNLQVFRPTLLFST